MKKSVRLTESQEDYIEAILLLEENGRVARVSDIATTLGVRKSSVTVALKNLAGRQLAVYSPYAHVVLTPEGKRLAGVLSRTHGRLKRFFTEQLGLPAAVANRNACRMEHALDNNVMDKLLSHLDRSRLTTCHRGRR